MKRPWHRRCLALLVVAGILLLAFAARRPALWLAGRWLDVSGPPQKADAVVLLNGSINTRPFVAAALVHGGWAPKIIMSTVVSHPAEESGAVPPSSEINFRIFEYGGVPRTSVVCRDNKATTTFDEAKAVAEYLDDHPAKRLLVVTEAPHTWRARWIFQRLLADRPVEIVMVAAPPYGFENETWWRSEMGFLFVVTEYFKLFFYGLRYGWLGYEIAGVAAVIFLLRACFSRRRKLSHGEVPERDVPAPRSA